MPQVGFEPTTRCLEDSRSIQLSYWDALQQFEYSGGSLRWSSGSEGRARRVRTITRRSHDAVHDVPRRD